MADALLNSGLFLQQIGLVDLKLINYVKQGGKYVIFSIDDHLARLANNVRTVGALYTILLPKDGYTPRVNYGVVQFQQEIVNFDIKYYTFIGGVENSNFKEITFGKTIIEQPTGDIDGDNTLFSTTHPYIPDSLMVFINGIKEFYFTEISDTQFTVSNAPKNIGFIDVIEVVYTKL